MLHSRRNWVQLRQRKDVASFRQRAMYFLAGAFLLFLLYKVGITHDSSVSHASRVHESNSPKSPVDATTTTAAPAPVVKRAFSSSGSRYDASAGSPEALSDVPAPNLPVPSLMDSVTKLRSEIQKCAELEKFGERLKVFCSFQYLTHEVRGFVNSVSGIVGDYEECITTVEQQQDLLLNAPVQMSSYVESHVSSPQSANGGDLTIVWDMGACGCTGWAFEVISYVLGIHERVGRLGIIASEECFCSGLPPATLATLQTLRSAPIESWDAEPAENGGIDVFISHKPPGRYPVFPYRGLVTITNRPRYVVGRSMAEVDIVPENWVDRVESMTDELWVPSSTSRDAFLKRKSSLKRSTYIVPEAFDSTLYGLLGDGSSSKTVPVELPKASGFHFFSSFKWEKRKGWDVLIRAFVLEFAAFEDVTLYIKTYLPNSGSMYAADEIERRIRSFVSNEAIEKASGEQLPLDRIHIISEETPQHQMPALYKSMDCFVLPTRGEGWGLPLLESMASGLPTIATSWGGQTEFMNGFNSYLIDVDEFVQADVGTHDWEEGQRWAEPSVNHLRSIMRYVFENRETSIEKGRRAAEDVRTRFSVQPVADIVMARLDAIAMLIAES